MKNKFCPIFINGKKFLVNIDEKIIFCVQAEERLSEKLCLYGIKYTKICLKTTKTIIISGTLALLLFLLQVEKVEAIGIGPIHQTSIFRLHQSVGQSRQYSNALTIRGSIHAQN